MPTHDRIVSVFQSPLSGIGELGLATWKRGTEQDIHGHEDWWELNAFTRGAQRYRIGDDIVDIPARHVLVVPPGVKHGPIAGSVNSGDCLWLRFNPFSDEWCRELQEIDRQHLQQDLKRCAKAQVVDLGDAGIVAFQNLIERHHHSGVHSRHLAYASMIEVFNYLFLGLAVIENQSPQEQFSPDVQRAVSYLREHMGEEISPEQLADMSHMHPRTFHLRFVRETGYTPIQFRTRTRLDWAERALRDSARSIVDIALTAGFSSSQYFATVFRRQIGCSPLEYRTRYR